MLSPASISFYGKLPWAGDFIARNISFSQHKKIDQWLSEGLCVLQSSCVNWLQDYLESPVWNFILPAGIWGAGPVCGAIMPSVDKVGRYFPFVIFFNVDAVSEEHIRGYYLNRIAYFLPGLLEREVLPDEIPEYIIEHLQSLPATALIDEDDSKNKFLSFEEESHGYWWQPDADLSCAFYADFDTKLVSTLFGGVLLPCDQPVITESILK